MVHSRSSHEEVLTLTGFASGEVVLLLTPALKALSAQEQEQFLPLMLALLEDVLLYDMRTAPQEPPTISDRAPHDATVSVTLMREGRMGEPLVAVTFGQAFPKDLTVRQGMEYAYEMVEELKKQLKS